MILVLKLAIDAGFSFVAATKQDARIINLKTCQPSLHSSSSSYLCQHNSCLGYIQRSGHCSCKSTWAYKNAKYKQDFVSLQCRLLSPIVPTASAKFTSWLLLNLVLHLQDLSEVKAMLTCGNQFKNASVCICVCMHVCMYKHHIFLYVFVYIGYKNSLDNFCVASNLPF